MIFGHLAFAGIAKRKFLAENFIFLAMASYGPDLLDKPASVVFGTPMRGLGHALLVFALLTWVAWFTCQRLKIPKRVLYIGAVLWLSHLATDLVDLEVLFWPFLGPFPPCDHYTLVEELRNYYILFHYPALVFLDLLSIAIALTLWIDYFLRNRSKSLSIEK
jgi:hypothetical protein